MSGARGLAGLCLLYVCWYCMSEWRSFCFSLTRYIEYLLPCNDANNECMHSLFSNILASSNRSIWRQMCTRGVSRRRSHTHSVQTRTRTRSRIHGSRSAAMLRKSRFSIASGNETFYTLHLPWLVLLIAFYTPEPHMRAPESVRWIPETKQIAFLVAIHLFWHMCDWPNARLRWQDAELLGPNRGVTPDSCILFGQVSGSNDTHLNALRLLCLCLNTPALGSIRTHLDWYSDSLGMPSTEQLPPWVVFRIVYIDHIVGEAYFSIRFGAHHSASVQIKYNTISVLRRMRTDRIENVIMKQLSRLNVPTSKPRDIFLTSFHISVYCEWLWSGTQTNSGKGEKIRNTRNK